MTPKENGQSGQATIEAALTLPVVLVALLLIVQVGLVVRDSLALTQAAREGARAAAITADEAAAIAAVKRAAGPLVADGIEIEFVAANDRGDATTVRLSYVEKLRLPIISRIASFNLPLRATATMRSERSRTTPTPSP